MSSFHKYQYMIRVICYLFCYGRSSARDAAPEGSPSPTDQLGHAIHIDKRCTQTHSTYYRTQCCTRMHHALDGKSWSGITSRKVQIQIKYAGLSGCAVYHSLSITIIFRGSGLISIFPSTFWLLCKYNIASMRGLSILVNVLFFFSMREKNCG
jgi:hypothetical protein